jgi:hypothetical protein
VTHGCAVKEITDTAERANLQFMDGCVHGAPPRGAAGPHVRRARSVMFMHNPRLAEVRKAVDDSDLLGHIKRYHGVRGAGARSDHV